MRVLIVVSCIFAAASAGFLGPAAYQAGHYLSHGYAGPQHIPVIGHNGVPLDTPEVAAGKVANAQAHAEAHARNGDYSVVAPLAYSGLGAHGVVAPYAVAHGYAGPQHIPVIGHNGVPLDTPEVAAGKIANAQAHIDAKARNGDLAVVAPLAYSGYAAAPVALANGVPLDTPEVAHAKAVHFAAHVEEKARHGLLPLNHYRYRRGVLGAAYSAYAAPIAHVAHAYPQHPIVLGADGLPLDTPEVAAGKVANAVAHAEAHARNGDYAIAAPLAYSGLAAHGVVAPYAVAHGYAAPQHIPVIGANGVPLDTPEVAAGKVANAQAHVEAHARNGDYAIAAPLAYSGLAAHGVVAPYAVTHGYAGPQHLPVIGANGVPLDTPEVAAGKVANAQAHVEAKARNGDFAVVAPFTHGVVAPVASSLAYSGLGYSGLGYNGLGYSSLGYNGLGYNGLGYNGLAYSGLAGHVAPYSYGYSGYQHIPVIGANGVPLDTPEVAAGKIANAQAHIDAKVRNGDLVHHY